MPPNKFPLSPLPVVLIPTKLVDDNPTVPDVKKAFKLIASEADLLAAQSGDLFPNFTYTHLQSKGINEARNHFQGIARLRKGKHLVVSGAFATGKLKNGHIFVIRMGSRPSTRPWGSNIVFSARPKTGDAAVRVYALDPKYTHPGGVSFLGDILVVPLQNGKKARILFLYARKPELFERLDVDIRPNTAKAGAAALTKLSDGRFVCAVWREVKKKPRGRIDFYITNDANLENGFDHKNAVTWSFPGFDDDKRDPSYQNITFITELRPSGRTQLYMIGTENESRGAPLGNGANLADLYRVKLAASMFKAGPNRPEPSLTHVDTAEFRALREYCNFDAGAGVYIDPQGRLHLYAAYHHRIEGDFRMAEFRSPPTGPIDSIDDAWIQLYKHDTYRGEKLGIYSGDKDTTMPNYRRIFVGGGDFDEKVSSVRYQIPTGHTYRLYRKKSFPSGGTKNKDFVDLVGTGKVEQIKNLKKAPFKFGDKVSSSRYE